MVLIYVQTPTHPHRQTSTPRTMARSPRRAARCKRPAPSSALRSVPRRSSSFRPRTSPACFFFFWWGVHVSE